MIELFFSVFLLNIAILYFLIKKKDLLNPIYLFILVLLSTYFIYSLKLSGLQNNYGFKSVVFILFIIITLIFSNLIKVTESKRKIQILNKEKYKITTYFLFIIIVFSYLLMWLKLGPPPLISKVDRSTYFISGIGTVYLLVQSLSFLIIYDWFKNKYLGKKSNIMFLIIVLMIVSLSNKFQLFYIICQFIILYNQMKKKISLKTFIFLLFVVIAIFTFYYNIIYDGMYISSELLFKASKMKVSNKLSFITTPYLYLAYNYDNLFNYMFNSQNPFGYGYYTLKSILESLNLNDFIFTNSELLNQVWKNNLQYSWLTTGTIFRELYMDFSYFGCIIGTFIIGLISKKSYKNMLNNPNIFNLYFYTSNIVSIFFLFFTNNFISINYITNLLCVYFISKYVIKKEVK